jgi:hypothetical protein
MNFPRERRNESSKREEKEYSCPGCTGQFTDSPDENYIQWDICEKWCQKIALWMERDFLFVTLIR